MRYAIQHRNGHYMVVDSLTGAFVDKSWSLAQAKHTVQYMNNKKQTL